MFMSFIMCKKKKKLLFSMCLSLVAETNPWGECWQHVKVIKMPLFECCDFVAKVETIMVGISGVFYDSLEKRHTWTQTQTLTLNLFRRSGVITGCASVIGIAFLGHHFYEIKYVCLLKKACFSLLCPHSHDYFYWHYMPATGTLYINMFVLCRQ